MGIYLSPYQAFSSALGGRSPSHQCRGPVAAITPPPSIFLHRRRTQRARPLLTFLPSTVPFHFKRAPSLPSMSWSYHRRHSTTVMLSLPSSYTARSVSPHYYSSHQPFPSTLGRCPPSHQYRVPGRCHAATIFLTHRRIQRARPLLTPILIISM